MSDQGYKLPLLLLLLLLRASRLQSPSTPSEVEEAARPLYYA